jgi:hypothetical protein
MISLLYYFGILTQAGVDEMGDLLFQIPNLVIKKLYVEQLRELLLPDSMEQNQSRQLARQFYKSGDLQPICDFIEQRYFKVFDNRDYPQANELTIKTAFLTLLFDDRFYMMESETALERRYADLTMIVRPEKRHLPLKNFFLELKFIRLGAVDLTGETARQMSVDELKKLSEVQQKFADAKKQLVDYQQRRKKKYADDLPIHAIAVVALGFERVVWERL